MHTQMLRETADYGELVRRRIRRILQGRRVIRADELSLRVGVPVDLLHAELESMVLKGEIRLLRPTGYSGSDYDCYATAVTGDWHARN